MTCGPLTKDQILDLYADIKIEITDRIKNPKLGVFDIDSYIKDLYNDLVDPTDPDSTSRALIYVQQVPSLLEKLIANERDIKAHFFKSDANLITKISKLAFDFTDLSSGLNAVARYVKKSKIKPEYITAAVMNMNETKGELPVLMYDDEKGAELLKWSANNKRLKPISAFVGTGQEYYPVNPVGLTPEERNALRDPDKALFYKVTEEIVLATKNKLRDGDAPVYRGTPVTFRLLPSSSIPDEQLTNEVKEKLISNPIDKASGKTFKILHKEGVVLALADAESGEFLYFNESGDVVDATEPGARLVYQSMRKVQKSDEGKLLLSNNLNYVYTLVSPKEIAESRKKRAEAQGIEFTKKDYDNIIAYEDARIKREVNTLYNLRNFILKNPDQEILLPIDGGSFGYIGNVSAGVLLSNTTIKPEDIKELDVEVVDDAGLVYFFANNGETKIYLQRSNMPQEVINKLADVLTTTATLPGGKQLTPDERATYARTLLGPTPKLKGYTVTPIEVKAEIVDGVSVLSIVINGVPVDPTEEGAKDFIIDALSTQIKGDKGAVYAAPLNYSKDSLNQTFIDYEIEDGKIKEVELNYFEFITPYLRVIYNPESADFVKGSNAYLSFSVPDDVLERIGVITKDESAPIAKTIKDAEEAEIDLEDVNDDKLEKTFGNITINQNTRPGYASAQEEAIGKASAVITFSENFDTATQTLIKNQADEAAKEYGGQPIQKRNNRYSVSDVALLNNVIRTVNNSTGTLFISGDSLSEMKTSSQKTVDNFMYETLQKILEHPELKVDISKVITTGQTGVSEAVAKAADRLGIPVEIVAPKSFMYRTSFKDKKTKKFLTRDVSNEKLFKQRFGLKTGKPKTEKQELSTEDMVRLSVTPIDGLDAGKKTQEILDKINDKLGDLERSKSVKRFIDSVFITKRDQQKALDWYNNESGLKSVIPLERITAIVNSNAFAKWNLNGITLFEGDGGTPVDIYHEAWHGFSQLYLTLDEKVDLYEAVAQRPKWQKKTYPNKIDLYREIEEELAEDFRSFMVFKKKFPGVIGRIFEKIARALRVFFSKVTKRDFLKPRDIAKVREYYDVLYKGEILNLAPSQDNALFVNEDLYRAKPATPSLVKSEKNESLPFTSEETEKLKLAMDNLMASVFMQYNESKNTSAGVAKILQSTKNRKGVYGIIKDKLELKATELSKFMDEYQETVIKNVSAEEPDFEKEALLQEQVDKYQLLQKALANFGDIEASVDGKQKSGLVAFHMENTRFNIIKNAYLEMAEDPTATGETTKLLEANLGNIKSSKEIANEDTWMVISSIFKPELDTDGNYITKKDQNGVDSVVYEKDFFGFDALQSQDIIWNKLARTLQASLTPLDIWNKLKEYEENYPEFIQLQKLLPNPLNDEMDIKEFNTETKFWQDFKKPRIPYLQLTITKETKDREQGPMFSSLVGDVTFDVFKVFTSWDFNFKTFEEDTNRFITKDRLSRNRLDVELVISEFSDNNGKFDTTKSLDFLYALGIILDSTSVEIRAITSKKAFAGQYGLDIMFEALKLVNKGLQSSDEAKVNAAIEFTVNPLKVLSEGLSENLGGTKLGNYEVSGRLKLLAELQNRYSNEFSNFSVQSPEKNRVWEHFLDSTLTRQVAAINAVDDFRILSDERFDIKKEFKHMRWMNDSNNPHIKYSVILNSIFFLDKKTAGADYGKKRSLRTTREGEDKNSIILKNIAGTQIVDKDRNMSDGINTSSADAATKFLQEMNTVLMQGMQEFMRHASKQMAQGIRAEKLNTYPGKKQDYLYVDIDDFKPAKMGKGQDKAFDIILGFISGEHERIQRFNSDIKKYSKWKGYNRKVRKKDGSIVMAGQVFTAFDDVLSEDTKNQLYKIKGDLKQTALADDDLYNLIKKDVDNYFNKLSEKNLRNLESIRYVDPALYDLAAQSNMTQKQVDKVLTTAYTYNSWIHNYETIILAYGDLAQYDHAKEEFHKRNAGLTSPGKGFRADQRARQFIQNTLSFDYAKSKNYQVRPYDGTLHTAILREKKVDSIYAPEYREELIKDFLLRYKDNKTMSKEQKKKKAEEAADIALGEYFGMKEADGQGHITFEAYRMLKYLEGNWSDPQEKLYQEIVEGKEISVADVIEYFPPYKLQYFGNIQTTGLSLTSFHKFSLAPLIPGVTGASKLSQLHDKMMKDQIEYVVYDSGSKIGHINASDNPKEYGDQMFDADGNIIPDANFTKNIIFAEYLKNQTEINSSYKEKSIFSTQMRKLVLEGLYEKGVIQSTKEDEITVPAVLNYLKHVDEYSEVLKNELLNEIGYKKEIVDGKEVFKPIDSKSISRLVGLIKDELSKDDTLGEHLLGQFINVYKTTGELVHDLSLHPEASKIEKLVLSLVNKRLIKQKVNGEPLVQVSASMYEGLFGSPISGLKKATNADIKKFVGSNFLPTYHKKIIDFDTRYENRSVDDLKSFLAAKKRIQEEQSAYWTDRHKQSLRYEIQYLEDKIAGRKPKNSKIIDDTTAAMKVMVALQGDFVGLLNLEYKGKPIETIDRLNEAIKDDAWLDEGDNRKAITMVGVRIPVQGLNSMEFMEVYHFLPAEAGNIIVPPAEIVAKSGGDFDIDKMTVFMPNITGDGQYVKRAYKDTAAVKTQVEESKANGKSGNSVFKAQKAGLENELIEDIRAILELPSNYASLITPNGTFLLKDIADDLAQYVMEYNPFENRTNPQKGKNLSPTRVLESEYNLYKHESNIIGKRTLGLGAIENTFNVVFNSLGASMPAEFMHSKETDPRKAYMFLKHNILINKKGEKVISLSNRFDADNVNKIADIFSQMINGWVDVEKDAWIFFIQGNYEVAPTLLYLVKAGVPIKDAIYFVSQPLVREYVNEQRLIKSTYADPLRRKTDAPVKYSAASNVISKYFPNPKTLNKGRARYDRAVSMSKEYFKDREAQFTTEEMYQLIKDSALQPVDKKVTVLVGDPTTGYKEVETVKTEFVESKAPYSELSQLMFLHFLQIETQIQGITQLKMNSNPDTSTDSTLFEAEETLANLETLETETKLDQDLFKSMLTDSVISSFFNEKMALGISKPLFPLRYHPSVSKFLIDLSKSRVLRDQAKLTFGEKGEGAHVVAFRNDLISYIFQNALRKYKLANSYTGYEMTDSIPVSLVPQLKFGAFVKENEAGVKTLYIDKKALKKEFESKEWMLGSESDNSYQKRKLFPLNIQHFSNNAGTNFDEYIRFVAEREFLRDLYPIKDNVDPLELKITKVLFPKMDEADQRRYTYERFLAHRALENTFNPYHLFKDPNYSFANKFNEIIKKHPDMMKQFKVLQRMKVDSNDSRTMFNVYLSDKDITNAKAGVYHGDLIKLADPNVQKVSDTQENLMISDFFEKMSIVAFLQSGLSKSKYSFTNIADFDLFLSIMQQEGNKFIKLLDNPDNADIILKDFNTMFVRANKFSNRDRNRFKNYLTKLDLADFDAKTAVESDVTATAEDTKLEPLNMPGVFIFKSKKNAAHYKALIKDNPEVVFFTNEVLAKLADKTGTLSFPGETMLADMSDGMSIRIPTSYLKANDNMANFSEENYPAAIERFERRIKAAKDLLLTEDGEWTGNQLAFSDTGYGDPTKMPEKLFVYLSRRLYEEFGYLNPGSEQYKEIQDIVVYRQGISDQEIIDKFDSETKDPFKCD